jgi:pyridoxal phosphate enzyme (YggS family)
MVDLDSYHRISEEADRYNAKLIAVSKKKSVDEINQLLSAGQVIFGENYVQELVQKQNEIQSAEWHFIGHLQTNKVKQIVSFISMIQSGDSVRLLKEIDKQAAPVNRKIDCLLEVYIATENTKTGFAVNDIQNMFSENIFDQFKNISIRGLMGMASNTEDEDLIRKEFRSLRRLFEQYKSQTFNVLSMGMTSDYRIALEEGSTMIRIGSAIFGSRI